MITISISQAAFAAIASTLTQVYTAVTRPDGKGGYLITLDRSDRLLSISRLAKPPFASRRITSL